MKPTLKLCSSHSTTRISKTPDLVTSLEPVPLLFKPKRGTTRESLIEGAKQKHTQREGLYDLRIRCRGVGQLARDAQQWIHILISHLHIRNLIKQKITTVYFIVFASPGILNLLLLYFTVILQINSLSLTQAITGRGYN